MATSPLVIRIGATMDVRLRRLKHEKTGGFVSDAVVAYTLFDANADPVPGAADIPMPFVAAPDRPAGRRYVGPLPASVTAELTPEASYTILILAAAPDGSRLPCALDCIARI